MIFDTHAHYEDAAFDSDREELLRRLPAAGIGAVMDVASSAETSRSAVRLAETVPYMAASVGAHPDSVGELSEQDMQEFAAIARSHPKVRAVGEIGLDYHWGRENADLQRRWFRRQLRLARELGLPVIIHSRDASQETFDILREHKVHGLIHCYSGTKEMAREFVKQGYYIALGGAVTFKNSRHAKEVAADIDVNYLLSETDCPYMAPEPVRGTRNDPSNIPYIVDVLAKCRNITVEEMASQIDANWTRFLEGR